MERVTKEIHVLFTHNSLPEYRIPWFEKMAESADCTFLITTPDVAKRIYQFETEKYVKDSMKIVFLENGWKGYSRLRTMLQQIEQYDFVELPPVDSLRELVISQFICFYAKKKKVKLGYFWEKWESPKKQQNAKRRVKNWLIGVAAKSVYKNADVIFSPGTKNREYFEQNGVKKEKIQFIPDASEMPNCLYEDIRAKYDIVPEAKILMYFGRLVKQKGLDKLLWAYSSLPDTVMQKSYLLIVGDGAFKEECVRLAQQLGIENVKFVGSVEPHLRKNYFDQCDVFVHPGTFYEGRTDVWGLTLNEAIQSGKMVISTTAVGSAYDLINSKNGFIVEEGNIEELATALEACVNDPKLVETAKEEDARLYAIYNCENMARVYINLCRNVL